MAKGVLIYDGSFAVSLAASVVRSGDGRFFATAKGPPLPSGPWQRAQFDIGPAPER
jgi:hypothetical protein